MQMSGKEVNASERLPKSKDKFASTLCTLERQTIRFCLQSITGDLCMHEALIFTREFLEGCARGKW